MTKAASAHPSQEQLAAFGLGRLNEEDSQAVEAHLTTCDECRDALLKLPADTFLARLQETTRELQTVSPVAGQETRVPEALSAHSRYRVLRLLGQGGMGVVYQAEHRLMERPVALKVINRELMGDPSAVERFHREVKGAARLTHPNIVTAYDAEQAGDLHFLVMEYVAGISLDRLVEQQGPLPTDLACDVIRQAALGLQHAHEQGLVHRDIKPGNLMRTPTGQIKILDFGLARFAREAAPPDAKARTLANVRAQGLTQVGTVMGTPDYMAPEQAINPSGADIRADLYSLGCSFYHLLTGKAPFAGGSAVECLFAHAERQPKPLSELRRDVPPALAGILDRLLAKDPAQRYQTPADLVQALDALRNAPVVTQAENAVAARESPQAAERHSRGRQTAIVATAGAGVLVMLCTVVLFLQRGPKETMNEYLTTLFTVSAAVGGTLLACQFLLSLFGLGSGHGDSHDGGHDLSHDAHDSHGEHHDEGHDSQASWFAGVLTFRAMVSSLTFFGLIGRASVAAEFPPEESLAFALLAAVATLFAVAWLMRSLYRFNDDGTVRIQRAVGQTGVVYLTIPGQKAGAGKVHLNLQNRTVEYQAVTSATTLPTGSRILVVAVLGSDTLEVVPASAPERISHV